MKKTTQHVYAFDKNNKPEFAVDPGETVVFCTMDCFSNQITSEEDLMTEFDMGFDNPAAGPVFVNGAEPGDVVAVDILDVKVADRGVAATDDNGCHVVPGVIPRTKIIEIEDGMADFNGIRFPIDPMIGVMGLAPAGEAVPCLYPANHGGNMDSKLIRKGSRVYFPVRVEGGLLQMGDIHAVMGDCEICGTGIEIPGEITVRISLIKAFELNFPLTETDTHWYVNGSGKDYQEALQNASTEMNRLIAKATGWDVTDSFIYMSLQCDIELNQACDPGEFPADIRIGVKKSSGIELI